MNYIKNALIVFVGMFVTLSVTVFVPSLTRGQKSTGDSAAPTATVKVINDASEPVPIAGTVNLSNPDGDPLRVRDVDNPARQPVHFEESYTVPAGKRLVVEYVSAEFRAGNQCDVITAGLSLSGGGIRHQFFPRFVGTYGGSSVAYGLSEETRLYVDANRTVFFTSFAQGCEVFFAGRHASGYLVDIL